MADHVDAPEPTTKPRKRKSLGRKREEYKKQKLSSHMTGPDCLCSRLKCFKVVSEENRQRLIDYFNSLPSKDEQDSCLSTLVNVMEIARKRPRKGDGERNNDHSYTYTVYVKNDDVTYFAQVCFNAFQSFFGTGRGRLANIKKSLASKGEPPKDQRGKHDNRPHKISNDLLSKIHDHIQSFQGRQSHYAREKTRRIYLSDDLNITKMFTQFETLHPNERVSYETYRTVFNDSYNISFGYPRTDTCSKCDILKNKIKYLKDKILNSKDLQEDSLEQLNRELHDISMQQELHQRKAETFYERKRAARKRSKDEPTFQAITFDYQKNLNVPNQSTNDFYYKRKLTLNSFNIHMLGSDEVFIYAYDETVAKKVPMKSQA